MLKAGQTSKEGCWTQTASEQWKCESKKLTAQKLGNDHTTESEAKSEESSVESGLPDWLLALKKTENWISHDFKNTNLET